MWVLTQTPKNVRRKIQTRIFRVIVEQINRGGRSTFLATFTASGVTFLGLLVFVRDCQNWIQSTQVVRTSRNRAFQLGFINHHEFYYKMSCPEKFA